MTVHTDPELGPMRWCRRCDEWWPVDGEFWKENRVQAGGLAYVRNGRAYLRRSDVVARHCRGCLRENATRYRARRSREVSAP